MPSAVCYAPPSDGPIMSAVKGTTAPVTHLQRAVEEISLHPMLNAANNILSCPTRHEASYKHPHLERSGAGNTHEVVSSRAVRKRFRVSPTGTRPYQGAISGRLEQCASEALQHTSDKSNGSIEALHILVQCMPPGPTTTVVGLATAAFAQGVRLPLVKAREIKTRDVHSPCEFWGQ